MEGPPRRPGRTLPAAAAASGSSRAEGKLRSRGCTSFQLGHLAWDLRSGDKEEIQRKQTNQLASGWGQWEEENKDLKAMVTPKHFPREQPSLKVQFGKWVERNRKLPLSKANVEVNREIIISPLGIEASLVLHYLDGPTKLEGCFLGFTSRREKPQDSSVLACEPRCQGEVPWPGLRLRGISLPPPS